MTGGGSEVLPDLVPARMLNEYAYCPRLAWLEWVGGEWADSADTVEGRFAHRSVDRESGELGEPGDEAAEPDDEFVAKARSVLMSAPGEGLIARMDLVEQAGSRAFPIDTKRGKVPDVPGCAYEPERVQICAQGLILRENGYACDRGFIYFAGSRQRVEVYLDDELVRRTRKLLGDLRNAARSPNPPLPLIDNPKCPRCSLVGICLPDETIAVSGDAAVARSTVRRLIPGRDDAQPLYLNMQGASLGKSGSEFVIKQKGSRVDTARIGETSQVCLFGNAQITTQALHECFAHEVPVLFFTYGGWFKGLAAGLGSKNVALRRSQYLRVDDPTFRRSVANRLISDKIRNSRTLLRRNHKTGCADALARLQRHSARALTCPSIDSLLGIEGTAAREYFQEFTGMLRSGGGAWNGFAFDGRNRRPPRDPINAMLSFAYSMLVKDWLVTLAAVGLDPLLGFYHQPRFGRPALALDMMEPFRPLVADSVVIWVVNNGVLVETDFIRRGGGCALKDEARKKFILAYEQRMDALITHPVFDYRISYRRVLEVQARLLARLITGEISNLPSFVTR